MDLVHESEHVVEAGVEKEIECQAYWACVGCEINLTEQGEEL